MTRITLSSIASTVLALALGAAVLPSSSAAASTAGNAKVAPTILISSPKAQKYRLGQGLLVRFSCADRSGIARCNAALGVLGAKARRVISGEKLRVATAGRYVLNVTATDRSGNSASKTLAFNVTRIISWSGYNWVVRPDGTGGPGRSTWSDSNASVRVAGSDLLLSIVKNAAGRWTCAEVDNERHLGYGTYRWVVATDLAAMDANDVLGMFTYGGPGASNNEIEIEPSRWGNLAWFPGSATVWQNATTRIRESQVFAYSGRPPYVNQFTWSPGTVTFLVTDATGATLFNWTVTTGVPTPTTEVPIINYWRFNHVAPAAKRTMRISGFAWAPLGKSLPPVGGGRART